MDDTDSRAPAMPDHDSLLQNLWLVGGISLGGGAFASQVAGVVGDVRFGLKLVIGAGVAGIIFACIWFFGSAPQPA